MDVAKDEAGPDRSVADAMQSEGEDGSRALAEGGRLLEFDIIRVIGIGGFGIVYLAHDRALDRMVAVKEYMPASLARRVGPAQVEVRSQRHADSFGIGMRSFINEARLLAQFDHPALVKVYRFWEANGTAYMVMPFYEGSTLMQHLAQAAPPDEAWLRGMLSPLLDALDTLHRTQCFHRDISPDNIFILQDGRPLLLDFGAARRAITDADQSFTVILKPGYAPIEQYADDPSLRQGPWTDLYALASVVRFAITGRSPIPSVNRVVNDAQAELAHEFAGRYSDRFLRAMDQCLAVRPQDRPRDVAALRSLLDLPTTSPQASTPPMPTPGRRRKFVPVLLTLLALSAVLAGAYLLRRDADVAGLPAAPAAVVDVAGPGIAKPDRRDQVAPAPADALDQIFLARDPTHEVVVELNQPEVRIGRDSLRMSIASSRFGYVYLFMVGSNGTDFSLLFPNAIDRNNWITPSRAIALPRRGWDLRAFGPEGTDRFVAIVSQSRRYFGDAGLRSDGLFSHFPPEALHRPPQQSGLMPVVAGKPDCPDRSAPCVDAYGAAQFSVREIQGP